MVTRREFLIGGATAAAVGALGALSAMPLGRLLLLNAGGGSALPPPVPSSDWTIAGAAALDSNLAAVFAANAFTVTESSVTVEEGFRPASFYDALWTRDNAYVIWHYPELLTAVQRRQFVTHRLATRSTSPADFIADRIDAAGNVTYKNPGASTLPFMDGIAFVVLALWADWNLTGDTSTFTANQSAIDDCLAAIPRSANGCVYSDPSAPSVDYGFTDSVLKTGDVAYGTALQAWAYKMLAEIAGEGGSGTYSTLRADAEAGLATLRQSSGWYAGSSGNNSGADDVWATALAVAEGLVTGTDRTDSAQTIVDAYSAGTITQFGLVRHLPTGQFWAGTSTSGGSYQNGGFWLTPLWDCVRAVDLVDPTLARAWAAEAIQQVQDEYANDLNWELVPWEWHNYPGGVGAKGYTPSAALVHRFV